MIRGVPSALQVFSSPGEDKSPRALRQGRLPWFGVIGWFALALPLTTGVALAQDLRDSYAEARLEMVERQIARRGVEDVRVLQAMERVLRHRFVPLSVQDQAYIDQPLPIGQGQNISQPYIVALMTELLNVGPGQRVLEIGTGSGYQAAVLAELAGSVYTIEIREELADQARSILEDLGYDNVSVRASNGYDGWPEAAPFDAILVTASPAEIPKALVDQLAIGGRMVLPLGAGAVQDLELLTKTATGLLRKDIVPVRFVPMIGSEPEN